MIRFSDGMAHRITELSAGLLSDMIASLSTRDEASPLFPIYRDTMAAFFLPHTDGKPEKFCKARAAGIFREHNRFHNMVEAARGDLLPICREHDPQPRKKGSVDDCDYWLRLDAAVTLSSTTADGDTSRLDRWLMTMEQMLKMPGASWGEKLDVALSEKLEQRAIRTIQDSGLLFPDLDDLAGTLRVLATRHGGGRMLLDSDSHLAPLCLIAESISAINPKVCHSNMYSQLWTGRELLRTAEAVDRGTLSVRQGAERVRYAGQVMVVDAIMYWYSDGFKIVDALLKLRAVPGNVSAAVEVLSCVSRAAEAINMDGDPVFRPLWVDLEAAVKGVELLAEHARRHVIPQVKKESLLHLEELRAIGETLSVQMWRE